MFIVVLEGYLISVNRPTSLTDEFPRFLYGGRRLQRRVNGFEQARLAAREYANRYMRPRALELDRRIELDHDYFDWELVHKALSYRLLSLAIPAQVGGVFGGGISRVAIVMEELCAACPGIANIFGAHALGISPVLVGGIAHWDTCLAEIARCEREGEPILMACAATEPGAGSDLEDPDLLPLAALNSRAEVVDGGYRLSGTKCFISNGNVARWVTVMMPVDPKRPVDSWSCFLVDTQSDGFSVGRVEQKLGQRACPAAEVVFDGVFVPKKYLIGRVGDGLSITMMALTASRPIVAAIATGIARGAYERLCEWSAKDGIEASSSQYFQHALAQIEMEVHLARQAYMDAAIEFDGKILDRLFSKPQLRLVETLPKRLRSTSLWQSWVNSAAGRESAVRIVRSAISDRDMTHALGLSSLSKVACSDAAVRVTNLALELVGLDATSIRPELEKLWRDAKLTQLYEGTNQINLIEVHRALCARQTVTSLPKNSNGGAF